jgi:cell division septation protein DedD
MKNKKTFLTRKTGLIGLGVVLTLALLVAAFPFIASKPQQPIQAPPPVRVKIPSMPQPAKIEAPRDVDVSQLEPGEISAQASEAPDRSTWPDVDENDLLDDETAGTSFETVALQEAAKAPEEPPTGPAEGTARSAPEQQQVAMNVPAQDATDTPASRKESPAPAAIEAAAVVAPLQKISSAAPAHTAPFTIQVGAFRNKENAHGVLQNLNQRGYHPFILTVILEDKGDLHMVRFGAFDSLDDANAALADFVKKENMTAVVARSGMI